MQRCITAVIELFVKSRTVTVAPADRETLGHPCTGPEAQMRAAASSRGFRVFPEEHREALDRVTALASALHEELVIWDVATRQGRKAARRKGVRWTPAVLFGPGGPESVSEFVRRVAATQAMRSGAWK